MRWWLSCLHWNPLWIPPPRVHCGLETWPQHPATTLSNTFRVIQLVITITWAVFQQSVLCTFLTTFPWPRWQMSWSQGKMWRRNHKDIGKDNCSVKRIRFHLHLAMQWRMLLMRGRHVKLQCSEDGWQNAYLHAMCSHCIVSCRLY